MSLNATARKPLVAPDAPTRAPRPRLTPVPKTAARRKPKLAYALVALGGAMAIGAAQIGLSLAITQDSYTLASLNTQQRTLDLQTDALQEELTGLSSPQALASSAAALGMVVAGSPSYLRLSDGAVFGTGAGAGWSSTVDPTGSGAVSNSLLVPPAHADANDGPVTDDAVAESEQLPPAITDGLPSPETH
ncbi:Cell division protein FtsL [Microbacterium hydrocarbonoxydans]|jgi:hypothetical protein|uniref:Cell division protein FtsL n=1 Tax=Microbacterium hydrocarbonoxydans TaxID=273678 RepID=A0A0M2HM25_9MICO|nr:hypothetical protein [Microbacterium hydrocarbonoxydans]KJL45983.1 Cell division protein FtsL [Microbacterium hydrocarbonoxydans]